MGNGDETVPGADAVSDDSKCNVSTFADCSPWAVEYINQFSRKKPAALKREKLRIIDLSRRKKAVRLDPKTGKRIRFLRELSENYIMNFTLRRKKAAEL